MLLCAHSERDAEASADLGSMARKNSQGVFVADWNSGATARGAVVKVWVKDCLGILIYSRDSAAIGQIGGGVRIRAVRRLGEGSMAVVARIELSPSRFNVLARRLP
jgi:hypothetical protein